MMKKMWCSVCQSAEFCTNAQRTPVAGMSKLGGHPGSGTVGDEATLEELKRFSTSLERGGTGLPAALILLFR